MARRWTAEEENYHRKQLTKLYVHKNRTINEIGNILRISPKTIYDRLLRLDVPINRTGKTRANNKRPDAHIPSSYSPALAEFFGIMLGDGSLSHFQVIVTLGTKELKYAHYVSILITKIFKITPKIGVRKAGYRDVYIGCVDITNWLFDEGLVSNKVRAQVDVPKWIFLKPAYMRRFVRGFFDTDGSIYKIRFGVQIALINRSYPLLISLQRILKRLGYVTSRISSNKVYITRKEDVKRFFKEIKPKNQKHKKRFKIYCVGSPVGGGNGL